MNNVLAQQPWKVTLAVGVLTAVLGGMVLGPGPSILISVTLFTCACWGSSNLLVAVVDRTWR